MSWKFWKWHLMAPLERWYKNLLERLHSGYPMYLWGLRCIHWSGQKNLGLLNLHNISGGREKEPACAWMLKKSQKVPLAIYERSLPSVCSKVDWSKTCCGVSFQGTVTTLICGNSWLRFSTSFWYLGPNVLAKSFAAHMISPIWWFLKNSKFLLLQLRPS